MSLKKRVLATVFGAAVASSPAVARANETSISLLGGYGIELRKVERAGASAYGWGGGVRFETTFPRGLTLAASFVNHLGSHERADDVLGTNGYRATRHSGYLGGELGWELPTRLLILRPYVGTGAWLVIDRAAVRSRSDNHDQLSPFILPGILVAYRGPDWHVGLDFRVPIAIAVPREEAAPTVFGVIGFRLGR